MHLTTGNKLVFLFALFYVLFLTGCDKNKKNTNKEVWNIQFNTSNNPGICYYAYKEMINTNNGQLTFQNRNDFSIHLIIFNETENGKVEYEADLDGGGILSCYEVSPDSDFSVGIRVLDGRGKDNVSVMVYANEDLIPYVLEKNN